MIRYMLFKFTWLNMLDLTFIFVNLFSPIFFNCLSYFILCVLKVLCLFMFQLICSFFCWIQHVWCLFVLNVFYFYIMFICIEFILFNNILQRNVFCYLVVLIEYILLHLNLNWIRSVSFYCDYFVFKLNLSYFNLFFFAVYWMCI